MSLFNDKLKRLHQSRIRALDAALPEEGQNRIFTADDVEQTLPTPIKNTQTFEVREQRWTAEHRHGRYAIGELSFAGFPQTFGGQLSLLADFGATDIGFFDIETTGLENNSIAYCIGLGVWEKREFVLRQWVLHSPDSEADVLRAFATDLQELVGIVSFNGKSFDVPRIQARCQVHGIEDPFSHLIHLDLLHIARRLLPKQSGIDLQSLERKLLMHYRKDDVPGSESPRLWNVFQSSKNVEAINPIIEHNGIDIVSLSGILHHFRQVDGDQLPATASPQTNTQTKPATDLQKQLQRTLERPQKIVVRRQTDRRTGPSQVSPVANSGPAFGKKLEMLRHHYDALIQQQDHKAAVQVLHELLAISPTHAFALQHLARHYESSGDRALAHHFLERLKALGIS